VIRPAEAFATGAAYSVVIACIAVEDGVASLAYDPAIQLLAKKDGPPGQARG
jgi:hypothetical protein